MFGHSLKIDFKICKLKKDLKNIYISFIKHEYCNVENNLALCDVTQCDGSWDQSLMVDPMCYFMFQPVLHDLSNKCRGMCYPICGMVHVKEPLLLIGKSSPCGSSGFPLSLSEWSFTICPTPYNPK